MNSWSTQFVYIYVYNYLYIYKCVRLWVNKCDTDPRSNVESCLPRVHSCSSHMGTVLLAEQICHVGKDGINCDTYAAFRRLSGLLRLRLTFALPDSSRQTGCSLANPEIRLQLVQIVHVSGQPAFRFKKCYQKTTSVFLVQPVTP